MSDSEMRDAGETSGTEADPKTKRWRSVYILGGFAYLWVMVAVVLGTLMLLGARSAPEWLAGGTGMSTAAWIVLTVVLAVLTVALARWLLRRTLLSRSWGGRAVIPAVVTLLAVLAALSWLTAGSAPSVADVMGAL